MDPFETKLDAALRASEPSLSNDGFSARVMHALPARGRDGARAASRWTLAGAAVAGGLMVWWLGTPLETGLGWLAHAGISTSVLPALLLTIIAVPTVWAFLSE